MLNIYIHMKIGTSHIFITTKQNTLKNLKPNRRASRSKLCINNNKTLREFREKRENIKNKTEQNKQKPTQETALALET